MGDQEAERIASFDFAYGLQRECARRRIGNWFQERARTEADKPCQYNLKLGAFEQCMGYVRLPATSQDGQTYTLWLFPNQLPNYLNYTWILKFLENGSSYISMDCRASSADPQHLFIQTLNKPI